MQTRFSRLPFQPLPMISLITRSKLASRFYRWLILVIALVAADCKVRAWEFVNSSACTIGVEHYQTFCFWTCNGRCVTYGQLPTGITELDPGEKVTIPPYYYYPGHCTPGYPSANGGPGQGADRASGLYVSGLGLFTTSEFGIDASISFNCSGNSVSVTTPHFDGQDFGPKNGPDCGMPVWHVSEPFVSLWLTDEPLGYQPALGSRVSFHLRYNQRETQAGSDTNIFSVGAKWNLSWLSYVSETWDSGKEGHLFLGVNVNFPGGGKRAYYGGTSNRTIQNAWDFRSNTRLSGDPTNGFTVAFPDGNTNVYGLIVTNASNQFLAFMTEQWNSIGQKTRFDYEGASPVVRLKYVVDGDGLTNTLYYATNGYSTNLIVQVIDAYGRGISLSYDHLGRLTNIVDVAGLPSSFVYNSLGYATNLITPYGTTIFQFTDNAGTNTPPFGRSVRVLEPDGSRQFYLYTNGAPGIASSYSSGNVPDTTPFSNSFENSGLDKHNTFHWGRLQYSALSNTNAAQMTADDFRKARMQHWLLEPSMTVSPGPILGLYREPSVDGTTEGQKTWFDYTVFTNLSYQRTQSMVLPKITARVLPDGSTWMKRVLRNDFGLATNEVSTYSGPSEVALRTNVYRYAANMLDLVAVTNALGIRVATNIYNAHHQIVTNYDALNQITIYTYDNDHRLTSISRPSGLVTTNLYGTDKFLSDRIDVDIATNSYTWTNAQVYTHTDPRGLRITNLWDPLQRLRRVSFPDNTFLTNTYQNLDLVRLVDRMSHATTYGYDALRRLIAVTNANGVVTRNRYCDCGSLTFITNAWNTPVQYVMENQYDLQGNLVYEVYPDRIVTNWHDSLQRKIITGDSWGYRWFFYNNQGLLTTISNSFGVEHRTAFDIIDRPEYVTDANGVMITNSYDALNRLRTCGYPDGGIEKFGYSARGMVAYTNQLGFTNFFAYDEAGRKIFATNANAELIRYTNSPAGDLLSLTDGKNQTTKWKYNEYGRVTNKIDQAGTTILKYTYDADGRPASRWSASKGSTYYTYDSVNNLTLINHQNEFYVTLSYDWLNRLTNMVDALGTTKYTYTIAGQLFTEDGPFADDTLTNFYHAGLRTNFSLQQPTGAWTNSLAYDSAKRLTNVTSPAGIFDYHLAATAAASPLIRKTALPNTSYITNTYDAMARLTGTWLNKSDNTTLDSATYGINAGHQRTTFTNASGTYVQYTNDPIGQLTIANSSVNSEDRGYKYDSAWNLNYRTNNGSLEAFTVNNKNQLATTPTTGVDHDLNGNMIQCGNAFQDWTYEYDWENQLVEMIYSEYIEGDFQPRFRVTFEYDGLSRLRRLIGYEWVSDPGDWVAVYGKICFYDGFRVIQERHFDNTPYVSYTRGTDLSGSLEGAGGIGGLLARSHGYSSGNWGTHNFYHADGNGNITYLVNGSQGLAASYRYDPFGNLIASSGSVANANTYRFSSKENHDDNVFPSMYYYGNRWYAPSLQRWLNRDPMGEQGGINLYRFVENDPIDLVDPNGLDPYGNPVSGPKTISGPASGVGPISVGPSGPVGPSNPYAHGGLNYPNGVYYKPYVPSPVTPGGPSILPASFGVYGNGAGTGAFFLHGEGSVGVGLFPASGNILGGYSSWAFSFGPGGPFSPQNPGGIPDGEPPGLLDSHFNPHLGLYLGAGGGLWVSNANKPSDLDCTIWTISINADFIGQGLGLSFSFGNGIWQLGWQPPGWGLGIGADVSIQKTTTKGSP